MAANKYALVDPVHGRPRIAVLHHVELRLYGWNACVLGATRPLELFSRAYLTRPEQPAPVRNWTLSAGKLSPDRRSRSTGQEAWDRKNEQAR